MQVLVCLSFFLATISTTHGSVDELLAAAFLTNNRQGSVPATASGELIPCFIPGGENGLCGPLSRCPLYVPLIRQLGDPNTITFFRQRICSITDRTLFICCPVTNQPDSEPASPPTGQGNSLVPSLEECGLPSGDRIINGTEIGVGSWPWLAALGIPIENNGFRSVCGGTLITRRHVLSAAHCFVGVAVNEITHVRLGEHHLLRNDEGSFPRDFIVASHLSNRYNDLTKENDIELLTLSEDVVYNDFMKPACLPIQPSDRDNNYEGQIATVVGWGSLRADRNAPTSLIPMEADVPITPLQPCMNIYDTRTINAVVDTRTICAGNGETDACRGDSGGPLNYLNPNTGRFYVIGIVSHGVSCASSEFPGVYTRVGAFTDWILNNLR